VAPQRRSAIYRATAKALASLHSANVDSIGLGKYGQRNNYCKRQVYYFIYDYLWSIYMELWFSIVPNDIVYPFSDSLGEIRLCCCCALNFFTWRYMYWDRKLNIDGCAEQFLKYSKIYESKR